MPISDYTYTELTESGRGNVTNEDRATAGQATRIFKVAWSDMPNFVKALKGGWQSVNSNTYTYTKPDTHPDWPNVFYVRDVDYEGMGPSSVVGSTSSWQFAKVTATYGPLTYDPEQPELVQEEELDFSIETQNLPSGSLTDSDGDKTVSDAQVIVPLLTYTIRITHLPNLPNSGSAVTPVASTKFSANPPTDNIQVIYGLLGKVNSANFKGAAPGQMLFLGAKASRSKTIYGQSDWRVEYKFLYRPVSWNKVRTAKGTYLEVTDGASAKLYTTGDFNALLPK